MMWAVTRRGGGHWVWQGQRAGVRYNEVGDWEALPLRYRLG